eukprot:224546-Karenia_brevis.AAC.1
MRGCSVAKHLFASHFGKAQLKFSAPSEHSPSASGGAEPTQERLLLPTSSTELSFNEAASDGEFILNKRLRMAHNRRNVLRARGLPIGSGPIFRESSSASSSAFCACDPQAVQVGAEAQLIMERAP